MPQISARRRQGDFLLDVDFTSPDAGVTALFGRSGSGKSSVINMVAGLARPDDGKIIVKDRILFDRIGNIDLPPHLRRIGMVFQDSRLFPHYTVRGNLCYGMDLTPKAERFVRFDEVVALLGLEHLLERRPHSLSGGEKQRVAIGRALLTSPQLLLMDEPLASLDAARKAEVLPYIALLSDRFRLPILYVSHAVDEVLRLADHMVLLADGKSVLNGSVEVVMSHPRFAEAAGDIEPASVVNAQILAHDPALGMTRLAFAGGSLLLPRLDQPIGRVVRVRIEAANVILALDRPTGLSVRNCLPAKIVHLRADGDLVDVQLDIGCPLHARITGQACLDLRLRPGMSLYALIKSAAIARADVAGRER